MACQALRAVQALLPPLAWPARPVAAVVPIPADFALPAPTHSPVRVVPGLPPKEGVVVPVVAGLAWVQVERWRWPSCCWVGPWVQVPLPLCLGPTERFGAAKRLRPIFGRGWEAGQPRGQEGWTWDSKMGQGGERPLCRPCTVPTSRHRRYHPRPVAARSSTG